MANKVFTIGDAVESGSQKNLPTLEKWKDVSMTARTVPEKNGGGSFKIARSVNVRAVRNSLRNIFTWIPGERILLPEFGSTLYMLLYEGITQLTEERIVSEIRQCVSEWEPRANIVEIRNASTIDDTEDNVIHIEVVFTIPELSDEQYIYSISYDIAQ